MKRTIFPLSLGFLLAACGAEQADEAVELNSRYSDDRGQGLVEPTGDLAEADLVVEVRNVEQNAGSVMVALQSSNEFGKMAATATAMAESNAPSVAIPMENVETGSYAVAVFQDTNGDGTLNMDGNQPTEPYGFSGPVQSGAPEFSLASFEVASRPDQRVAVNLR